MKKKTLQEVLKENHEECVKKEKAKQEKLKKEEKIETIIVSFAMIFMICIVFYKLSNLNNKCIQKCINKGYSEAVCIAHL